MRQDRIADARLHLQRHALPTQMAGRPPAEIPPDNQRNLEVTILAPSNPVLTTSKPPAATAPRDATRTPPPQTPDPTNDRPNESRTHARHASDFRKIFNTSMDYLSLEYVDLLSLNSVNNRAHLHDSLKKDGCLAEARKLQEEGRCRYVGLSTTGTQAHRRASLFPRQTLRARQTISLWEIP